VEFGRSEPAGRLTFAYSEKGEEMKIAVVVFVVVFLLIATAGPATAQDRNAPDQIQKWKPVIGKWQNEEEQRSSPTASWTKTSSEWEISWLPGGYAVEIHGNLPVGGGYVEFHGYDPQLKTLVGMGFTSNGVIWRVSSEGWHGTTLTDSWTDITPDGTNRIGRCTWEHSADFKTMKGTCDLFTDGQWWTWRKVSGTKVE
jgi:hypothetical protein